MTLGLSAAVGVADFRAVSDLGDLRTDAAPDGAADFRAVSDLGVAVGVADFRAVSDLGDLRTDAAPDGAADFRAVSGLGVAAAVADFRAVSGLGVAAGVADFRAVGLAAAVGVADLRTVTGLAATGPRVEAVAAAVADFRAISDLAVAAAVADFRAVSGWGVAAGVADFRAVSGWGMAAGVADFRAVSGFGNLRTDAAPVSAADLRVVFGLAATGLGEVIAPASRAIGLRAVGRFAVLGFDCHETRPDSAVSDGTSPEALSTGFCVMTLRASSRLPSARIASTSSARMSPPATACSRRAGRSTELSSSNSSSTL